MYTEVATWLKLCGLTYIDLAHLMGISESEAYELGKTRPVPRILKVFFKTLNRGTYMMSSASEKHTYLKEALHEQLLEPHEILGVNEGDLEAGAAAKSELVRFYSAQNNEKGVRRAANAFEMMCDFAKIFEGYSS
jgi:hypothetical protein